MQKEKLKLFKYAIHSIVLYIMFFVGNAFAQVYVHDFGTATINSYPYIAAPVTMNPDLSGSVWTNNTGSWVSFVGSPGQALGLADSSGPAASVTLSFTIAPGKQLNIDSFSFWRQRSPSGAQNWTMTVNGINVGTGSIPTTGAATGTLAVANPVTNLTGTVNVVISLSNASGVGTFRVDNFTLNGSIIGACTAPVITSLSPSSGSAGTVVTINGSGFQAGTGTSAVQFNGVNATSFTVVSDNIIKATVPATATTGTLNVTTNACIGVTPAFTMLNSDCAGTGSPFTDIFISELYDHVPGSYGVIELYNPTNNTITFNGEYVLERLGDVGGSVSYTLVLPGSIGPEMTYMVLSYGTGVMGCSVVTNANMGTGINDNDEIRLRKNGTIIDISRAPSNTGYTVIRDADAVAPSATYSATDWSFAANNCGDLGNHITAPVLVPVTITTQPQSAGICENATATFTVTLSDPAGFTFQWKTLNASGNWINVTNGTNYSGANTATLTVNATPLSFNSNQYYCEMIQGGCTLITNTVQLTVNPAPAVADVTVTQPTCAVPTGTITINSPLGAGITYSIDGGTTYQAETTFANLAPGPQTITVKNAAGCTSVTPTITINPVPAAPAIADVTVTQPTCTVATGTITINSPLGTGITYSFDGTTFHPETTYTNLVPGPYTITVKSAAGCTSVTSTITINPAPAAPAVANVTVTQPTCAVPTGTITINSPIGPDIAYSIDGGTTYQAGTTFSNLVPGPQTVTVKNADGCTSVTATITINPAPGAPAVANVTVTQPTCTVATGAIEINSPVGAGITYSLNGTTFVPETTFTNLAPGPYTVTVKNAAGCTSVTTTITITPAPGAPAVADVNVIQPTCTVATGTININSPVGAGITYSLDGTTFVPGTSFTNLTTGSYTVTVKNAAGCTSVTTTILVDPAPAAPPVADVTVTQPTCAVPTGTITINAPTGMGLMYSIDGIDFQTETTFSNLNAGTYNITVQTTAGCTSVTPDIILDVAPEVPALPEVTITQPTCTIPSGSVTVNIPTGNGLTYSINGVDFQAGTTFNNLAPGSYTITVKSTEGCTRTSPSFIINQLPTGPLTTTVQECRDTAFGKNYMLEVVPSDNSFDADTASYTWRNGNGTSIGSNENTFNVAQYVASNTINAQDFPLEITVTVRTAEGCESTALFTVDGYLCTIPKGISPNNDGMNDSFNLAGLNVEKLSIFNRYGREVYAKNNYKNEWIGQTDNDNELPTGTYFYVIEVKGQDSQTGWIYINRQEN